MRSYADSIKRLGTDKIDMLLLHDIDAGTHGAAGSDAKLCELFNQGGYRALDELRSAGHITAIGAGVNTWQICERLLGEADFDGFLLAGRYTLLEQDPLETRKTAQLVRQMGRGRGVGGQILKRGLDRLKAWRIAIGFAQQGFGARLGPAPDAHLGVALDHHMVGDHRRQRDLRQGPPCRDQHGECGKKYKGGLSDCFHRLSSTLSGGLDLWIG